VHVQGWSLRADRNRAIFRGIEVVASVLIGVFDINESRQDTRVVTPVHLPKLRDQ